MYVTVMFQDNWGKPCFNVVDASRSEAKANRKRKKHKNANPAALYYTMFDATYNKFVAKAKPGA